MTTHKQIEIAELEQQIEDKLIEYDQLARALPGLEAELRQAMSRADDQQKIVAEVRLKFRVLSSNDEQHNIERIDALEEQLSESVERWEELDDTAIEAERVLNHAREKQRALELETQAAVFELRARALERAL